MRTVVIALATIAILTAPAYSQTGGKRSKQSGSKQQTAEQKKKKAADLDKAYKAALDKIPDKNEKRDPWGKIR
jgi:uncharacterized protein YecT (DUF1311 family)